MAGRLPRSGRRGPTSSSRPAREADTQGTDSTGTGTGSGGGLHDEHDHEQPDAA